MSAYPKNVFTKVVVPFDQSGANTLGLVSIPMAANQTIKPGDLLILSSGKAAQAVALPSNNNSVTASAGNLDIQYVAVENATTGGSVTNANVIRCIPLSNENLGIILRAYDSSPANTTQANFAVGSKYRLARWRGSSSSQSWYCLTPTTENGDLTLAYFHPESGSTDQYTLLVVKK
ncbi:MAG: hypothetical protein MUC92_04645 [Fimbriimonadaceae bacterium]|jgi:hypothetical protein|nr:hypothetical protein [Fimbriimonadaceae bacterium]